MDALAARALMFQRKLSIKDVDWSIPGLPELDNQLSCIELGEDALEECRNLSKLPDGTISSRLAGAASVCKSLVMRDSKERLYSDTDIEGVSSFGHSVLAPLEDLVALISGISTDALANAKKNYPLIPASALSTSSPTESVVTPETNS